MKIKLNTTLTDVEKGNRELTGRKVEGKRPACAHWLTVIMRGTNPELVVGRTRIEVRRKAERIRAGLA